MLRKYLLFLGAFLIILIVFFWTENNFAPVFQSCISQNTSNQGAKETEIRVIRRVITSEAICSLSLVDRHSGFFAAIAAFIAALFTFALKQSTARLWKTEERNFRESRRAFVFLDDFNTELTTAADAKEVKVDDLPKEYKSDPDLYITRFAVAPRWKNSGDTPTRNMTIQVDWCGPTGDLVLDYSYKNKPPVQLFIGPKAVELSRVIEMPGVRELIDWSWDPSGDPPLVLIWGRADYEDVFGRQHWIEWCRQLRFDRHDGKKLRASFIQWGDYNRSDDSGDV